MKASKNKLGLLGMKLKVLLVPRSLLSLSPLPCAPVAMSNHEVSSFVSPCLSTIMPCLAKDPKSVGPAGHMLNPLIL